jgi:probable rRNA maturation factor
MIVLDSKINDPKLRRDFKSISTRALERFGGQAQRAAKLRGEVHVLITSSRAVRALNRRFRKKDKPTDVLSFLPVLEGRHGGDIAISGEIALQQARALGHSLAEELKVLMLHGMLHLAGYDHEHDDGEMAREEERLRRTLGLTSGLIRRTHGVKRAGVVGRSVQTKPKC